MSIVLVLVVVSVLSFSNAATPGDCSPDAMNNSIPMHSGAPPLIREVPNGKLFLGGSGVDTFYIVHVYGNAYEQGFAQGQLMTNEVKNQLKDMTKFFKQVLPHQLPNLPHYLYKIIADYGFPMALQMCAQWTRDFTPKRYLDEIQGIADGAGVTFDEVNQFNLFPELTKADCTVVGANGKSTPDGLLSQLRGLDFNPLVPMKDSPQVTVYHEEGKPTVMTVGWTAMTGALTGISSTKIGVGEKLWFHHGKIDGLKGQPWMTILRDVLYTKNMDEALEVMKTANRTCAIHVGVGDSTTNTFRGLTIAQKAYQVFNDTSLNYPGHPIIPGVMYWSKYLQPSHHTCLESLLTGEYGNLDAATLAAYVSPMLQTGNLHTVTFDYGKGLAYIANARKTFIQEGSLNAYNRMFTVLDLASLFAEPAPVNLTNAPAPTKA